MPVWIGTIGKVSELERIIEQVKTVIQDSAGNELSDHIKKLDIALSALRDALKGANDKDFSTLEADIESINGKLRTLSDDVFVKDLSVGTDPIQVDADTKVRSEITLLADDGNSDVIYVGNSGGQLFPLVAGSALTLRNCSLSKIYVKAGSGTQLLHVIAGGW